MADNEDRKYISPLVKRVVLGALASGLVSALGLLFGWWGDYRDFRAEFNALVGESGVVQRVSDHEMRIRRLASELDKHIAWGQQWTTEMERRAGKCDADIEVLQQQIWSAD